jgi:hypothetical protein
MGLFDSFGSRFLRDMQMGSPAALGGVTPPAALPAELSPVGGFTVADLPKKPGMFSGWNTPDAKTGLTKWDGIRLLGAQLKDAGDPDSSGQNVASFWSAFQGQQQIAANRRAQELALAKQQALQSFADSYTGDAHQGKPQGPSFFGVLDRVLGGDTITEAKAEMRRERALKQFTDQYAPPSAAPAPPTALTVPSLASPGIAGAPARIQVPIPQLKQRQGVPSLQSMAPDLMRLAALGVDISPFVTLADRTAPDIHMGPNGVPYDARDPNVLNQRFPNPTIQNGFGVDLNDPATIGAYFPEAPTKGATPVYGPQGKAGGPVGWRMMDGSLQSIESAAQAQSAGTAAGQAPYEIHALPNAGPGGGTLYGTTASLAGPNGPLGHGTMAGFSAADASYAGQAGRDVASLMGSVPELRSRAIHSAQAGRQGLSLASQLDPTAATPLKQQGAEALRALGWSNEAINSFAGDAKAYQQLTSQLLLDNAKALGANPSNRDAQILQSVFPSLSSPASAATLFFATQAATADKQAAYADFLANWQGAKDPQTIQRAWTNSPDAQRSIFQNSVFNGLRFGGRPLVLKTRRPASDGFYYGQVNIGSKPQRFRIYP